MFEVKISTENVIKSVFAWSALHNRMGGSEGVLGLPEVKALEVIVRDESEMLAASLFPWVLQFDTDTLTYHVDTDNCMTNVKMLKLLTLFERAVTYGVLRYLSESGDVKNGRFAELRGDAIGGIRMELRSNNSTNITPWRW